MKNWVKFFTVLCLSMVVFFGCGPEEKNKNGSSCPSLTDSVTWDSYGSFTLNAIGRDSTARNIVDDCAWHVFNGHNGGVGGTLQIASENEEVVFVWAYNSFYGFRLTKGWQGATQRGVMMGDTVKNVLSAYPEFRPKDHTKRYFKLENDDVRAQAYFDENGLLEKLLIGYYFRG